MNLKGRSFLTLMDFSPEEIEGLLSLAAELKAKKKAGVPHADFAGKNIVTASLRWCNLQLVYITGC